MTVRVIPPFAGSPPYLPGMRLPPQLKAMALSDEEIKNFERGLGERGETQVRLDLTRHLYGDGPDASEKVRLARLFLENCEKARKAERHRTADDRSVAALGIAKEANKIAKGSKSSAFWANVIAVVAIGLALFAILSG